MCVLIFSTTFVRNISNSKKKWARYDHKYTYFCLHVKYRYTFCPILIKLDFLDRFSKNTQISNFMKMLLVGAEFQADGHT